MDLYEEWLESKHDLESIKKKELRLRNEIIENKVKSGKIGRFKFSDGMYDLVINCGLNTSIDESELDTFYKELSESELAAIKYKPSLIKKEFDKLEGDERLFDAIIQKPSQPTLEIKTKDE